MLTVKRLENTNDFISLKNESNSVFSSKEWLDIYSNSLQLLGIYQSDNKLIGGFYFLKTKKLGFSFFKLPPYTPNCGLFFIEDIKNKSSLNSFKKEINEAVCDYLISKKFHLCVLAFPLGIDDMQPFIWKKFKVIPHYTYTIDLSQSIESIVSNFDSKNRNAINKAVKDGITVEENSLGTEELYSFFRNTLEKSNANIYNEELKNIFLSFSNHSNSFALNAFANQKHVGTVFCIYDKIKCYYLLAGIDKSSGLQGINNLLVLKSIEKAKALGCQIFDFEGSMLKGVEKFFRSFGGELQPYFTINKANIFIEIFLKFIKRSLF